MQNIPSYIHVPAAEVSREAPKRYIRPCQIVSWSFIYFFSFTLRFAVIFLAGRNLQLHDIDGNQSRFINRTSTVAFFLALSFPFMYYSALFGHYFFPAMSYLIPLATSFYLSLQKYDGQISARYYVLWIPVHFCVLVVWYFVMKTVSGETFGRKREIMKAEFLIFFLFYLYSLMMLEGLNAFLIS